MITVARLHAPRVLGASLVVLMASRSTVAFADGPTQQAPAPASTPADNAARLDEAKTYFGVGAQAYERGDFLAAIAAFEEAQRRAPKPAVTFSIAQAHRRQYYIDKSAEHLTGAAAGYRQYLKDAPAGPRAADAAQYLAELGPAEERVGASGGSGAASATRQATRLSVSASSAANARVSLDGAAPVEAPLIAQVKPGKHVAVVTAPGYQEERREIVTVENAFVAIDVALKESPASLHITGDAGPRVEVDGRLVGTLPLAAPVSVPPGVHIVAVSEPGHDPQVREVHFARNETKKMDVSLRTSSQRKVAYGAFIGAGALGIASLVFGGLAISKEGTAQDLLSLRAQRPLTPGELGDYQSARDARSSWTTAAIVTGVGAGVVAATGLVLYLFDDPSRSTTSIGTEKGDDKPAKDKDVVDVGFAPVVAPGYAGAGMSGRF